MRTGSAIKVPICGYIYARLCFHLKPQPVGKLLKWLCGLAVLDYSHEESLNWDGHPFGAKGIMYTELQFGIFQQESGIFCEVSSSFRF
jgi:hypothetical protein